MSLGEQIRDWRWQHKLTQVQAAKLLNIDRSYLGQVEKGREPGKKLIARFESLRSQPLPLSEFNLNPAPPDFESRIQRLESALDALTSKGLVHRIERLENQVDNLLALLAKR